MSITPVRQSASKEEFLRAVQLNEHAAVDKWRFRAMWEEVVNYWVTHFETNSRGVLRPEYASNMSVQSPYKWAHLDPAVINGAICEIWSNGAQEPRIQYDKGHSEDQRVYNWVLKWLLWHVCRYRDWRNRRPRPELVATSTAAGIGSSTDSDGKLKTGQFPLPKNLAD